MLVKSYGAAVQGIDAIVVTIEVSINAGFMFSIVGLPDAAVKESQERVMSAISMSGHNVPHRMI
ncbi:MAG: magnesium chelatase, partial [Muribaculaceae bacterium]|nr:magnesium chelatase [Muribaculaceae bacterium]